MRKKQQPGVRFQRPNKRPKRLQPTTVVDRQIDNGWSFTDGGGFDRPSLAGNRWIKTAVGQ